MLFRSGATFKYRRASGVFDYPSFAASDPSEAVQIRCRGKIVRFARKTEVAATLERYEFQR